MPVPYPVETTDHLVVGCGIAGLRAAVALAGGGGQVTVITKDEPASSSTWEAQGGIAVALGEEDRISLHQEDTLAAGDGLCDAQAVRVLVEEGPALIQELISWGMEFDREGTRLAFTREGAHSARRVLHAGGDSTGRAISQVLLRKARACPNILLRTRLFTVDLLLDDAGRVSGMRCLQEESGQVFDLRATAVCLATGGLGRLFRETTNPPLATGDGMAMAARAGAELMDMEFVQFHPTALRLPGAPPFLLSEALRGEGAYLRNMRGERFLAQAPGAELAPRDVVSRAIVAEVERTGGHCVYLDLTHLDPDRLPVRFPKIFETCRRYGIDLRREPVPVYPAAHYSMGGVRTDTDGRASVPGLYAAGEVACAGVHGANRLASNSLLEGLVFGARAGNAMLQDAVRGAAPVEARATATPASVREEEARLVMDLVAEIMWNRVGVVRDGSGLQEAVTEFASLRERFTPAAPARRGLEARNLLLLAQAVAESAAARRESRGAHYRRDFPGHAPEPGHSTWPAGGG